MALSGNTGTIDFGNARVDVSGGAGHVLEQASPPQTYSYDDSLSGTGTALGTTADVSLLGLPFASLVVTKSASSANTGTADVYLTTRGGYITITATGGETIAINAHATISGTDTDLGALMLVDSTGAIVAATALASGTYMIYMGR